jgi:hypothetical protein
MKPPRWLDSDLAIILAVVGLAIGSTLIAAFWAWALGMLLPGAP